MKSKFAARTGTLMLLPLLVAGCAKDPALSYPEARTAAECRQMFDAELSQWQIDQAAKEPSDQKVDAFFANLTGGIGLLQGEALFKERLAVCVQRVGTRTSNTVFQPGAGGNERAYACRTGGGVFQGGSAICPGF